MPRLVSYTVLILLLAAGLVATTGCPSSGWVKLKGEKKIAWNERLEILGRSHPSVRLPTETGYWIDQGYGWQGPYYKGLLVPFYVPKFKFAYIGNAQYVHWPTTEPEIKLYATGSFGTNPVGRMVQISADEKAIVYMVEMKKRTADGFYCLLQESTLTTEELFVYVDPNKSFDPIEKYSNSFLDGSLRIIGESGRELHRWEVGSFDYMMVPTVLVLTGPLPEQFSIEFRMDGSVYLFSHWATMMYVHPVAKQSFSEYSRLTQQDVSGIKTVGKGIVNFEKSTNLSVWMDWTLRPVGKDEKIYIRLNPGLEIVVPAS